MSNIRLTREMVPSHATHPGKLLLDEIEYRHIRQKNLAHAVGVAPNVLNELLHGKRNLTAAFAMKLEKALGIDAGFLMRLQVKYEIDAIRIKEQYGSRVKKLISLAAEPKPAYRKKRK